MKIEDYAGDSMPTGLWKRKGNLEYVRE